MGDVHLLPSNIDLAGAEVHLLSQDRARVRAGPGAGARCCPSYDFVLIDCPPSLGILTINGLTAAHEVLVPLQCETLSHRGVGQLLETIDDVRSYTNPDLRVRGVIATMFDSRTKLAHQVIEDVPINYGLTVLDPPVPKSVKVAEAPSHGPLDPRARAPVEGRGRLPRPRRHHPAAGVDAPSAVPTSPHDGATGRSVGQAGAVLGPAERGPRSARPGNQKEGRERRCSRPVPARPARSSSRARVPGAQPVDPRRPRRPAGEHLGVDPGPQAQPLDALPGLPRAHLVPHRLERVAREPRSRRQAASRTAPWPGDDLADLGRPGGPGSRSRSSALKTSRGGHGHDHADAEVEHLGHLVVADLAEPLDLAEDPRGLPGRPVDDRVGSPSAACATRLPGMPPPVMWATARTSTASSSAMMAGA